MSGETDLQVVGAGVAGLVAAALAAEAGLTVRLYEERSAAGGRARTVEHHGFRLNQGPHALYLGGGLDQALRQLGIVPKGAAPAAKGAMGRLGDRQGLLPQGIGSLLRTTLLSAGEKRRLATVFARLPRLDTAPLGATTVEEWLGETVGSGDLADLLGGVLTLVTYNRAHELASADAALANLQMALADGVLYLDGGWQQIIDRLEKRCANSGRVERVGLPVRAIGQRGDRWVCETDDGRHESGAAIVAGLTPPAVDRLLGDFTDGHDYAEPAGPPVRASALDVGLVAPPTLPLLIGLDTSLYASLHSVAVGLAPEGAALMTLVRYLHPDDTADDRTDDQPDSHADLGAVASRELLRQHCRHAGIADDEVVMERYLHRLTVTWGMPLAARGGLAGRPPVAVTGCPGLSVAGDWVGPAGLLADAAAASATVAVERSIGHLGR